MRGGLLMRLAVSPILLALALGACTSRSLTGNERVFTETVVGNAVAFDRVEVFRGAASSIVPTTLPVRPRTTCRERLSPPRSTPARGIYAAFVLGERMFFSRKVWQDDFVPGYPDSLELRDAMRLAHELVHVWQWQSRRATGYSPLFAAVEHIEPGDPYLVEIDPDRGYLDYGWEQQGILVEEFVCCRALDPAAPRTRELHRLVAGVFPGAEARSVVPRAGVVLPHADIDTTGICR